ncbi:MAG: hypothetical protein KDA63_00865 [Planctomycetales bacterium]|nr:hypothetical protein [Planctomycetales bacterium]
MQLSDKPMFAVSTAFWCCVILVLAASHADGAGPADIARPDGTPSNETPTDADNGDEGWLADAELLAEQLVGAATPTDATAAKATPIALVDVLAGADTGAARLNAVRAYWDLWAAITNDRDRRDELARLRRLEVDLGGSPESLVALTAKWQALVEASGRSLGEARQRIAEIAIDDRVATAADHAAPADAPHVGPYRTEFKQMFTDQPAAGYMYLLAQSMPARHRALAARGVAVDGALAMVLASAATLTDGKGDGSKLAWRMEQLHRQRTSFVELVRRYNHDIARYALSVAPPDTPNDKIVGMLVLGVDRPPDDPATPADAPTHQYLSDTPSSTPVTSPGAVAYNLLPARPHFPANDASANAGIDAGGQTGAISGDADRVGPKRVVSVARTLFDGGPSELPGEPMSLADALAGVDGDRMTVITNYWWAATSNARVQAMKRLLSRLVAPHDTGVTGNATPLGWAYFAQLADVYEAEIDAMTAMHELVATSRWEGSADVCTTTVPHAGRYRTKADRQTKWQTDRDEIAQLAQQVDDAYQALDLRTTLYVDALRADTDQGGASRTSAAESNDVDAEVRSWQRRHDAVDDLLAALADYNVAIGQYVLAVLPKDEPTDALVSTLVVTGK